VTFQQAAAQALLFSYAQFGVVLTAVMLRHLPPLAGEQCAGDATHSEAR